MKPGATLIDAKTAQIDPVFKRVSSPRPVWQSSASSLCIALRSFCLAALVYSAHLHAESPALTPEGASGFNPVTVAQGQAYAVAAANPLAAQAGVEMLEAGGSAMDAAVAVQMVLTLVEPQSSGIGGGAFLLHYDGQHIVAWDGRETAPQAVNERLFLDADGQPLPFMQAAASGRSVGVPGLLVMLEAAHAEHGRLAWSRLFEPAIRLAENGFPVSPRLHSLLATDPELRHNAAARRYFYTEDGQPQPVGHRLSNPALASMFRQIAQQGSQTFMSGAIAQDMVERVTTHPVAGGQLSTQDLAEYRAIRRSPMCTEWRTLLMCGFPPPSSGHLAIMQILGILEALPGLPVQWDQPPPQHAAEAADAANAASQPALPSGNWLHRFIEASRLAFADRAMYLADPHFVSAPAGNWHSLLSPGYLHHRATLIGEQRIEQVEAGQPDGWQQAFAPQTSQTDSGTSHISIIDPSGNAVSMTSTIESAFGARILADGGTGLEGGYLLNNQLTDFSFRPADDNGTPIANRVEPGKRPRSSMSPMLVFDRDSGKLLASLGSPGGAAIIAYTARTALAIFDWGLNVQEAIDLPHAVSLGGPVFVEQHRWPDVIQQALRERGHEVIERELTSGLHAIVLDDRGWQGGADPRREGVVVGR